MTERALANMNVPASLTPAPALLQLKCTCGSSIELTGECEECRKKRLLRLQPKLRISEPGNRYEQDADRVGEQVMSMEGTTVGHLSQFEVQRLDSGAAGPLTALPIVHEVLQSPGQPLDPATRAYFGPRFEDDFVVKRFKRGRAKLCH